LGWITGTPDDVGAKTAYDAGIAASMSQHGIAGAAATAYATQPSIVYNPATAIAQIIYQKYVANFMCYSYETWADWRRTNFPALVPHRRLTPIQNNSKKTSIQCTEAS
jgi:hypothetical protein